MKKKILCILMLIPLLLIGCNDNKKAIFTNTYYNKAIILIKDKHIEVKVKSWTYGSNGVIRIETKDGKCYLTDSKNIIMINDKVEE